jgi:DNA-binding NarL/FixJ family response regulator
MGTGGGKTGQMQVERMMIVEDNVFFLQFLKKTLHSRFPSIDILEAADGEEAFQKIQISSPDIILMDLRLPGENGLELTKRIKAQHPNIIVVIITNYDLPQYREAAYQCKVDHFLTKDSFLKMMKSILTDQNADHGETNQKSSHE